IWHWLMRFLDTGRGMRSEGHIRIEEGEVVDMVADEGWIKKVLLDAWDVVVDGVASERKQMLQPPRGGEGKWKIESRTKIKSLTEGLSEFEDAGDAVLHFV
ncbi:hypothetical protein DRN98_09645, partial [Methanosarcinales archaeon]